MKEPIESKAIKILRIYDGGNDYIIRLKNLITKKNYVITQKQAKYIIENYNKIPIIINQIVDIHQSQREFLMSRYKLDKLPEKLYVYKLLCNNNDLIHILGSFHKNDGDLMSIFLTPNTIKKNIDVGELTFDEFTRKPYPHQEVAIKKLLENNKFILADDMGLGKTSSSIIAAIKSKSDRILIVCPATLKYNWRHEIMFYDKDENISIVEGSNFELKKWTIINYDILKNFHKIQKKGEKHYSLINESNFDLVIVDEAHYLKNSTSNRTKLFIDFSKKINKRWFLTGTPITNRPMDFYTLLKMCNSPLTDNWIHYVSRYCDGKQINVKTKNENKKYRKVWLSSGSSNLEELQKYSSDVILRRTKKNATNLPKKTIKPVYLKNNISVKYTQYINEYETWLEHERSLGIEPKEGEHLTKLLNVRLLLSEDKIKSTIQLAEDLIENDVKVVIFSCFKNTLNQIYKHFGKQAVIVDGNVSNKKRDDAVRNFQNNKNVKIFCGNIIAAGVGITLTEGSVIIFNDLDWVPSNHAQAEDRIFRIGQTQDVHIIYPLVENTIDIDIYNVLKNKMKIINTIMGDEMNERLEEFTLTEDLLGSILNKQK